MTDGFKRPDHALSLKDQAFLKELGISGLSRGEEHVLKAFEANKNTGKKIEMRAEGLQSLGLDRDVLDKLARDRSQSADQIGDDVQFFRDLNKLDEDPDPS